MRSAALAQNNQVKRHFGSRHRGGSLMEMMLVLPLLIMLGFGVVDYGYYFYVRNTFQAAAAAGARAGSPATATDSNVTSVISNMMSSAGVQNSAYQVTLNPSDITTATSGSTITVTITTTWGSVGTNMLSTAFGGISSGKVISASASMLRGTAVGASP